MGECTKYILATQNQDSKTKQLLIIILFSSRLLLGYNTYPKETPLLKSRERILCEKKNPPVQPDSIQSQDEQRSTHRGGDEAAPGHSYGATGASGTRWGS